MEFNRYEFNNFNIIITEQSAVIEATLTIDADTFLGNQQDSMLMVYEARKIAGSWKITTFGEL